MGEGIGTGGDREREDLVERLRKREPLAFEEFLASYGPGLLRFGRRMCGHADDAREVLQDTLLKTFQSIDSLKSPAAFKTWLFRIAANACLMRRRRSQFVEEEIPLEDVLPMEGSLKRNTSWDELPERALLNEELRSRMEAAILDLPPNYRLVLLMRDVEGLSTEEVAEALSLSRDVVKMRLHRARAKVRNALDGYLRSGEDPGGSGRPAQGQA